MFTSENFDNVKVEHRAGRSYDVALYGFFEAKVIQYNAYIVNSFKVNTSLFRTSNRVLVYVPYFHYTNGATKVNKCR